MGRSVVPFVTGIVQPINAVGGEAAAGHTGASGKLRVEPEQLDGVIAVFEDALATVGSEVKRARTELDAMPLANDQVSTDAANAFNRVGYVNEDSAVRAWKGAVQQLRSIIEQLNAAKQTIVQTDTENVSNFQVLR
jgi:PE family